MKSIKRVVQLLTMALVMTLAFAPFAVQAKNNSKPAGFTKAQVVYSNTDIAAKKITLVVGSTGKSAVSVDAIALLRNTLSSDYVTAECTGISKPAAVSVNRLKKASKVGERNTFEISGNKVTRTTNVKVTFICTVSNNDAYGQKINRSGKNKDQLITKKVTVNVAVVPTNIKEVVIAAGPDAVTRTAGGKSTASPALTKGADTTYTDGYGIARTMKVYSLKGTDVASELGGKATYKLELSQNGVSDISKAKFGVYSSNSSLANITNIKYDRKAGKWTALLTVNSKAYSEDFDSDGYASAKVLIGAKETEYASASGKEYRGAAALNIRVKLNGNQIKSAYATVGGRKTTSTALAIPAGQSTVSVNIGAEAQTNCAATSVTWTVIPKDSSDNGKVYVSGGKLYAKGVLKKYVIIEGKVAASNTTVTKTVRFRVTKVTKKADSVNVAATSGDHNYYGSTISSNFVNGNIHTIHTYYFAAPDSGSYTDTFTVNTMSTRGIDATDKKVKLIKDSDSDAAAKVSLSGKYISNKRASNYTDTTVTVKINKYANGVSGTHIAYYAVAANDSYDRTSCDYGTKDYVAIVVTSRDTDAASKSVSLSAKYGETENTVSNNILLAVGETKDITVTASANMYYSLTSSNEDVAVVKVDTNKYRVEAKSAGNASVQAKWVVGMTKNSKKKLVPEMKASNAINFYVVGPASVESSKTLMAGVSENMVPSFNLPEGVSVAKVEYTSTSSNFVSVKSLSENGITGCSISGNRVGSASVNTAAYYTLAADTLQKVSVNAVTDVEVTFHTLSFEKSSYEVSLTDKSFVPAVTVDGKNMVPDGTRLKLTIIKEAVASVSGNHTTVSLNGKGITSLKATYYVNGYNAGSKAVQLTVNGQYKNVTVVSFNPITATTGDLSDTSLSMNGTPDGLQREFNDFNDLFTNSSSLYTDFLPNTGIQVTVSINGEINDSSEGQSGSGAVEESAPETSETVAAEEPVEDMTATEAAVSENLTSDNAVSDNAVSDNAVSNNAVEDNAVEAIPEITETVSPAGGTKTVSGKWIFTYTKNTTTNEVELSIVSVNEAGKAVALSTDQQDTFITDTFGTSNDVELSMDMGITSNVNFPQLLSIIDKVMSDSGRTKKSSGRTIKVTVNSTQIVFKDLKYENGSYTFKSDDTDQSLRIDGSGNDTVMVFDEEKQLDDHFIKKLTDTKDLVKKIIYYNSNGEETVKYPE